MIITFCGHSTLYGCGDLSEKVRNAIRDNLRKGESVRFYCGGYGAFDELCARVCWEMKTELPNSEVVFVTPYLTKGQQPGGTHYDGVVYPPLETVPPRFAILRRNEWMVDHSARVIAVWKGSPSGTKNTVMYANRKGVPVINILNR